MLFVTIFCDNIALTSIILYYVETCCYVLKFVSINIKRGLLSFIIWYDLIYRFEKCMYVHIHILLKIFSFDFSDI